MEKACEAPARLIRFWCYFSAFSCMQLYWHGLTSVRIEATQGDTSCTLLTDPFRPESGLKFPRGLEPNVLVLSHQDREKFALDAVKSSPLIVADPGEYEVQGIFVFGTPLQTAETNYPFPLMYRFEVEGISIGFLGAIKQPPTEEMLGRLENVDVLLISVGGGEYLTAKQATDVVHELEPRIVIPLAFALDGDRTDLATVEAFCKEVGGKRVDGNKLKLSRKDLPADDLIIQVLERA